MPRQCSDGGVEVVDVHGLLDDVVTELVGLTVHDALLDAAAGEPDREALGMVIAAVIVVRECALAVDRAAELTTPDHQRVVEQPALFQVVDQGVAGLVDVATLVGQIAGDVEMLVPAAMEDLDEPDVAFDEPACQQSTPGERAWLVDVGAVHVENVLGFVRDVGQFGNRGLHPKGHLVLGDASLRLGIGDRGVFPLIEPVDGVERAPPRGGVDSRGVREVRAPGRRSTAGPLPGTCWGGIPSPRDGCRWLAASFRPVQLAVMTTNVGRVWFMVPRP